MLIFKKKVGCYMEKVLITGVSGQLGHEIYKQLLKFDKYKVYGLSRQDLDVSSIDSVKKAFNDIEPHLIINCAAMTNVDLCETNPEDAYKVNTVGPENLAKASHVINSRIVHISTDYVFGSTEEIDKYSFTLPYTESDKPNPINIYGKSKLAGERAVTLNNPKHFIIRTSWLYGNGHNFVNKIIKLGQEGSIVKVVNDQYGSPTSTTELTRMLIKLVESDNYGLYHGASSGGCSRYEFAKVIFESAGIDTDLVPISSKEYPTIAKRPHFTVLSSSKLSDVVGDRFPCWRDALHTYITYIAKGCN